MTVCTRHLPVKAQTTTEKNGCCPKKEKQVGHGQPTGSSGSVNSDDESNVLRAHTVMVLSHPLAREEARFTLITRLSVNLHRQYVFRTALRQTQGSAGRGRTEQVEGGAEVRAYQQRERRARRFGSTSRGKSEWWKGRLDSRGGQRGRWQVYRVCVEGTLATAGRQRSAP